MLCLHYLINAVLITILVALIIRRPRTMFMLTWGPVAAIKEVGVPSLVRYGG